MYELKSSFPKFVSLYLTNYCTQQCSHCFLVQNKKLNSAHLSVTAVKKIINLLEEEKVFLVSISGGDPVTHPDFIEIISLFAQKNIVVVLGITGVELPQNVIDVISQAKNIPCIQLSLDGYNEQSNDVIRGRGSFKKILINIKKLQNININVNLAFCLHNLNFNYFHNMLKLAKFLKVFHVKVDFWKSTSDPKNGFIQLTPKEEQWIYSECISFMQKNNCNINWIDIPNYNLYSDNKTMKYKLPSLIISETGDCFMSGYIQSFANINHASNIALSYQKNVDKLKIKKYVVYIDHI